MIDAFSHAFTFSLQLTCFIHVRRNIKDKCVECNLPGQLIRRIQDDIFGKIGSTYFEGLVDVCSETVYNSKLDAVIESWQNALLPSTANIQKVCRLVSVK